jgi:hypothetical protein
MAGELKHSSANGHPSQLARHQRWTVRTTGTPGILDEVPEVSQDGMIVQAGGS